MFDRLTPRVGVVLAALMVVLSVAVGGAAAVEDPQLVDETIEPDENTETIWIEATGVEDMGGDDPVNVSVTLTGMNESDDELNDTEIDSDTLEVDENATEEYEYDLEDADLEDYDEIVVEASVDDGDEDLIDSADWGTLDRVGGAGGGIGGDIGGEAALALALLVGAFLLIRRG